MDSYYSQQASLPYFSGAARQRGSGMGALALGVSRFALPVLRNVLIPAAKRFGANLFESGVNELSEVAAGRSTLKRAAKRSLSTAAKRTLSKQRGSGGSSSKKQKSASRERLIPPTPPPSPRKKQIIRKKTAVKRSRYDILKNIKN